MMIQFKGGDCKECPFFRDATLHTNDSRCTLDGLEDISFVKLRPTWDGERPEDCPFNDVHGLHVEIHNQE